MLEPTDRSGQGADPAAPSPVGALQDLAQAFLSFEHASSFYPEGHQSLRAPLERLLELMRAEAGEAGEAGFGIAGEALLWRGAILEEPPPAARKLAALLGDQGIARIAWTAALTAPDLKRLVGRLVRSRGATRRSSWDDAERFGDLRVESRDYESLMTDPGPEDAPERRRALWRALLLRIIAEPEAELSADDLELLRETWLDPAGLAALLVEAIGEGALSGSPEAVAPVRRLAGLLEASAAAGGAEAREQWAGRLAEVGRLLPPALRLRLLEAAMEGSAGDLFAGAFGALTPGEGIALLGRTFAMDPAQIERLTRVFQYLVPRQLERMELAPRLREKIREAGDSGEPLAENAWEEVQELFTGEAGEFMSPAYREQLRQLAAREEARRGGERALAGLPEIAAALAPPQIAGGALRIQLEQLRLATDAERYREALEGLAGLCTAALAAGDRERGLLILRRLLELRSGDEQLAGPRPEIERSLRSIVSAQALAALLSSATAHSREEQDAIRSLVGLVPAASAPALLDLLVAEEDAGRRRQITALLHQVAPAAVPEVVRRLQGASAAVSRALLPLITEVRDPAAVPVLLGLLGREDPKLRRDALRALLLIDTPEVRRALPGLLEDRDEEIVQAAAIHLGAVGSPETVRDLVRGLAGGRLTGRRVAEIERTIFVLGRMRSAEAVAPLADLVRRRAWINRRAHEALAGAAVQALARIGGDEARKALEQAAGRGSEKVAAACRRLLARWGSG